MYHSDLDKMKGISSDENSEDKVSKNIDNTPDNIYKFNLTTEDVRNKIYYVLSMIPYPSGAGMHLGHVINYSAIDAIGRFKRLNGYKVLNPICWDSFGLPTENYAMKLGKSASDVTEENIKNFKNQALKLKWGYDWDREFATSSPEYYKWTQWIFSELYKKGLVYRKNAYVNFCPKCNTSLANDQIIDGKCERDETEVIQKHMPQWFIKITDYADRLIEDLEGLDWPEGTKQSQINWIGKREGLSLKFKTENGEDVDIFNDEIEYLDSILAIRICPEHEILDSIVSGQLLDELLEYRKKALKKTNIERQHLSKESNLFSLGVNLRNPINGKKIPLIVDEKILSTYGTGTELVIPELRETDNDIIKKLGIKILNNSITEEIAGKGKEYIEKYIINNGFGKKEVIYKLRDWSVSRQRYWGAPIPMYYDDEGNPKLIDSEEYPVKLPLDVDNYKPTGKSPLEDHSTFPNYKKSGHIYKRECDTLDTFVDSSFYYLRFLDSNNESELLSKNISEKISNVDFYMGGTEHNVGHLLYARFIHKFLYDIGVVNTKEPFKKLFHQGMILSKDGRKMSKRWGNVVDPMKILETFSADVLKMGVLFLGPLEQTKSWDEASLRGIDNFLKKVNLLVNNKIIRDDIIGEKESSIINSSILNITSDIENTKLNTAISKLMVLLSELNKLDSINTSTCNSFLIMLSLFAPEKANEMWIQIGNTGIIHNQKWPKFDETKIEKQKIKLPIQINGKLKSTLDIEPDIDKYTLLSMLKKEGLYEKLIGNKDIKKIIFIPNRIINFVL